VVELAEHARPWVSQWAGSAAGRLLNKLARAAPQRAELLDGLPRCLVHHDFNPRNVGFRLRHGSPELCAFDWELATLASRNATSSSCCVLSCPPTPPAELVWHYVEFHRKALERAIGTAIDGADWSDGFRLALEDFAVQRLTMYVMAHRLRSRPFLERVTRAWAQLMAADARGRAFASAMNSLPSAPLVAG